jgi:hypothetical protein
MGSIILVLVIGGVLHNLAKPRRKTILTSFCDNIINNETKECFLKYLFHAHYIMPDMLIPVNEVIAKFFTLIVDLFERSYGV